MTKNAHLGFDGYRPTASLRPSGDHESTNSTSGVRVNRRCPLPSAFMTYSSVETLPSGPRTLSRLVGKAILLPSGDHTTSPSFSGCLLRFRGVLPPPVPTEICWLRWRTVTNRIVRSAGIQPPANSCADGAGATLRWPLPSAFITYSSLLPSRLLVKTIFRPSGDQMPQQSNAGFR